MDEMTASAKRVSMDGELKVKSEGNDQQQSQQRGYAEARRRRMEIRHLRAMANSGSLVEPVSKRSRTCYGDVKPSSSIHVLGITTFSSSFQTVVGNHHCYDGDDVEGEGESIPLIRNDNTFEPRISPSLQQDLTSQGNGLPTNRAEDDDEKEEKDKEEEENFSSTLDAHTSTLLNISTATSPDFGSDESSGELCSSATGNNCNSEPNGFLSENHVAESPLWCESAANPLASPQEGSSVTGSVDQELVSSLEMQSGQSDHEAIVSTVADSLTIAATLLVPPVGGGNGCGANTRCVAYNRVLPWGSVSIRGMRAEMEDAMAVVPEFLSAPCGTVGGCLAGGSKRSNEISALHFFGVYDGHGGPQVTMKSANVTADGGREKSWQGKWEKILGDCFLKLDAEVGGVYFRRDNDGQVVVAECVGDPVVPETVGTTAVVAVVGSCQIIVSNCGDSRAVLSRGGRAIPLSVDHKPDREDELARIEAAGGKVINWKGHRIFGVLAMSRAIGDRYLKPSVIPDPEVTFTQRTEDDECLILASDGLWDVLSNEEVCRVARRRLARGHNSGSSSSNVMYPPAQAAAEYLSRLALERNSSDNITVVVVDLKGRRRHERRN
uniref:protein-serine/threonine phosphatase n=1 Tax=Araucaria cunninghamii TaxID=56994 RepID=A0A0D6QYI4_ARACU